MVARDRWGKVRTSESTISHGLVKVFVQACREFGLESEMLSFVTALSLYLAATAADVALGLIINKIE